MFNKGEKFVCDKDLFLKNVRELTGNNINTLEDAFKFLYNNLDGKYNLSSLNLSTVMEQLQLQEIKSEGFENLIQELRNKKYGGMVIQNTLIDGFRELVINK